METYKKQFIDFLLDSDALQFGSFVTKSGRKSPYFINAGKFNLGDQVSQLGFFYASSIQQQGLSFDTIFGPAYKGIPLAIATVISLAKDFKKNASYAFNRKEAKDHGDQGLIVGADFTKPQRLILVDDVITAGTAIREVSEMLTKNYPLVKIEAILISVDRQERGQRDKSSVEEISESLGIKIYSIVKFEEILTYMQSSAELSKKYFTPEILVHIGEYRKLYGV